MEVTAGMPIDVGAVRVEMATYLDLTQESQTAAARAIGISGSALSQWLMGKYAGDNDKVAAQVQRFLELRNARQVAQSARPTAGPVQTTTFRRVQAVCAHASFARTIGVIVGAPGLGKTFALEHFVATHPLTTMVTVRACNFGGPKQVFMSICDTLRLERRGTQSEVISRVFEALKGSERLLIFDESQHLQSDTLELLRQLHDACRVGMVWAGNPRALAKVATERDARFAQIWSRIGIQADLDADDAMTRVRLDVVALATAQGVTDPAMHERLFRVARRGGFLRSVDHAISLARSTSTERELTAMDLDFALRTLGWTGV